MVASSSFIIAASSLFALAFGAPLLRSDAREARSLVERAAYKVFGGDGTTGQGWPDQKDWKSFEDLWTANLDTLKSSCDQFQVPNNSDAEIADLKSAIESASSTSSVPKEYILAIVMQESKGCVRVHTTNYGVRNPGLMQDHDGKFTCNEGGVQTPCPADQITGMITDGVGITTDFGLKQVIEQAAASDVSKFYKGARLYNSGSIGAGGNLGAGIATHCYATDVANRLIGWTTEASGCDEATIGTIGGSSSGSGSTTTPPSDPTSTTPAPSSTPSSTTGGSTGGSAPTAPKADGAAANCTEWYTVKAGDSCASTGVTMEVLTKLNTGLSADCSNLFAGEAYCTKA